MRTSSILHWAARALAAVSTALIALMATDGLAWPNPSEWALIAFFPIGVVAGFVWAWRTPAAGGTLSVLSLVGFYLMHRTLAGGWPSGPWFAVFSAPAAVFLAAAVASQFEHPAPAHPA